MDIWSIKQRMICIVPKCTKHQYLAKQKSCRDDMFIETYRNRKNKFRRDDT
jgi:hypothetical protein